MSSRSVLSCGVAIAVSLSTAFFAPAQAHSPAASQVGKAEPARHLTSRETQDWAPVVTQADPYNTIGEIHEAESQTRPLDLGKLSLSDFGDLDQSH